MRIQESVLANVKQPGRLARWWAGEIHSLKVFLGLELDWSNPENAPPAWESKPHRYIQMPDLKCCPICGGGRLHSIHVKDSV